MSQEDQNPMRRQDLPKGLWRCQYCEQNFCTPLSCLERVRALNSEREQAMKDRDEQKVASDQEQLPTEKPQAPSVCAECQCPDRQHGRECSYHIAVII